MINNHPIHSYSYLLRGFKLIWHKRLRHFVLIPIAINIIIFSLLLGFCIHWFGDLITWINKFLPQWLKWLDWILWILFSLASLLGVTYTFSIVANLIGAPFNSLLAEKVEELLTKQSLATPSNWIKDIPRNIKHEGQKILYYLPRAILCLLLFFIPVIQIAAPFIWLFFNAWTMSLQYLDYPMDNHRMDFHDIRKQLSRQKLSSLSFGSAIMLATMLPIVNFLVMPSAVVGATILWLEKYRSA